MLNRTKLIQSNASDSKILRCNIFLISVFALALTLLQQADAADDRKLIFGVFYEGCENTCEGFKAEIAESGFDAEIVIRDIEQDKTVLPLMVEKAREMQADLVLTYGTSGTLGVAGTFDDIGDRRFLQDIPIVFTVVADPFGTRIAESFEGSGRDNVTGTFNRVPESSNIEIIKQYDPGFKRLGLLYNSNERNSVVKMEELREIAPTMGIELIALEIDPGNEGTPESSRLPIRMKELGDQGIRWVYLGSSSFLKLNGELYTSLAVENNIAIVSPYESLVRDQHALLSIAANRIDIGRLAAQQALKILRDGVTPGELPIVRATDFAYVVNMDVARKLNLFPSVEILQVAETVHRGASQ